MDEKKVNFGDLFKKLRIEAGFAQQAELSKVVGVTQQTVSRWESGKSVPKAPQIRKLASILKIDEQILLEAAGYAKQSVYNPVTISYDNPFPFMSLTSDGFERFCSDLLSKTFPKSNVHRWGGVGHKQSGIDIKIDFADGTVLTYQCKREAEFGSQKVKEAIEYQTIAADKKYILLARIASPQARQEASRHEEWDILDQEDLSRMVRDLSKHEQKRLVDIYFFGQRMALIGEAEPGIWRDSSSHFAPFMNPSNPLNHTLPLIGRLVESQQLYDACIEAYHNNEIAKRIIYLVGVAGIGKSRLLKHVVDKIEQTHQDISILFWDGISNITAKDIESLGDGKKILVADGCRKAENISLLFDLAIRNQNITLTIATRYDEFERIKCEASDLGIVSSNTKELNLMPLSESETQQLALQVLKAHEGNEKMASHIAKWTTDSPLATVLTTYIALKENISFAEVRVNKEFKEIIKGKFSKVLIGEIGLKMDQVSIHQILRVLALVQPFDILDDRLVVCIARLERLESTTIKRVLRILIEAGVLRKNQNNDYSLSPEVLSDLIIEDVCLGVENKSTGYADTLYEVLDTYASAYICNLIYNLSRFEWTANMHTKDIVSLLDSIWSNLQDSEDDIEIIGRVAYYQPKRTIDFIAKKMIARLEENVRPNSFSDTNGTVSEAQDLEPYDKHSQEYLNKLGKEFVSKINNDIQSIMNPKSIFDDLTPIIQTVALHKDFLAQSCDLMWLSLKANYNHPMRILKEIFSYKPDKPQDYLTVVIDWAIDLLKTYHADEHLFSPFDFLGEIMKTEGTTMEASSHSIKTSVAPLRCKVIEALLKTLVSTDIKKAYEAAKFLPDCLTYSEKEDCPWFKEAIDTLERIKIVVEDQKIRGLALVALNLEIDQLLLREEYPISRLLRDIQTQIHKTIQDDKELCMSAVMMGKWDWLQPEDETHVKTYGDVINSIFDKNTLDLKASYDLVNSKYREMSLVDKEILSKFNHFFSVLCDTNLDFSELCVQQALNPQANDSLWQFAWIPLSMLLHYNRSKGQEYAAKLLISSDKNQRELVGQAYGNLSMKEYQLNESDNAVFTQILNDSDESVILSGLIFIKEIAFCDGNYQKALDWLIRIRKDVSDKIIEKMFSIIRHTPLERLLVNQDGCNLIKSLGGDPTASTLKTKEPAQEQFSKENLEQLCEYLIPRQRIPFRYNDGIEAFLLKLISVYPNVVLDLVLKRAEYAVKNKLLVHTFFPSYQIIDMQFLNRETNGVFPKDHEGVKNSRTLLSAFRNFPNVKDRINQWIDDHNDESKSYENVKQFLQVEILGEPAFDKKADKLMAANTEHVFKEARDYISKKLPNIGDKGWLTYDEVDKSIKDFNSLVRDGFIASDKLDNQEESKFAKSKWRTSSETQKFEEEVKPLYALFKGYPKAYHRIFNHSIDSFDTQAIIIPCDSPDNTKKQRYTLQLFPSQEKPEKVKVLSRIKFCGDREQYDGCIEFSDGLQQKVEVTVANKGEEQGKLKADMRQNGYAMSPLYIENNMAYKCLNAIKNKLDKDKHRGKYSECWLVVVLNGWQFGSIEDIESFLHFCKEALQAESYTIDWTKIKSIIFYPGN